MLAVLGVVVGLLVVGAAGLQAPSVRLAPMLDTATSPPTTSPPTSPLSTSPPTTVPVVTTPRSRQHPSAPPRKERAQVTVPTTGQGGYRRAKTSVTASHTTGRLIRFDLRVERGMPFDPEDTARFVASVLNDDRSWTGSGRWRFQLVDDADEAELHAWIVSRTTTNHKCFPLLTRGQVSCQNGNNVVLNATRWAHGAKAYGDDLLGYRTYLVNHEFGHYLGYGHVGCPAPGKRAPVMMQQTKGVGSCRSNPWPAPDRD
ncbi:MAG: DUF3152 domain-containing protein [Propionibacteriaceae bacterium]